MRRQGCIAAFALLLVWPGCRVSFDDDTGGASALGNRLTVTFDRDSHGIYFDRSEGTRHDGGGSNVSHSSGFYGEGGRFTSNADAVDIPDVPELFLGNKLTIEAWIFPEELNREQVIYGDLDASEVPAAEVSFEISATNRLTLVSNAGCSDPSQVAVAEGVSVEAFTWSHVAVTWDGSTVSFYINGDLVESQAFAHSPCESSGYRPYHIGNSNGLDRPFFGNIDEVKVSDSAKSARDIRASMLFNSVVLSPRCGDLIVELNEQCEGDDLCCDAATCQVQADGTACGAGGTCSAGSCQLGGGRVTTGLVALYEFKDATGATVADSSGVGTALDLTINDETEVTWDTDTLEISNNVIISSGAPADKIRDAIVASGELTIEAWVQPEDDTLDGPARIVTMSDGTSDRNVTLGQEDDVWIGRIRSTAAEGGYPHINSADKDVDEDAPNHVVITRNADGVRRIYVNGKIRGTNHVPGDFSNWDNTYELHLGNEVGLGRDFPSVFHLVAIYSRALSADEVAQNHTAGADP